ncbi:MAG: hypothetical protein K2X87_20775 [Gemmataceae bacterium]|nr:hypothetical protein [Gemmataceae bacterium]
MTDIHIRTRLDSVTPHLPDLAPLVGREVEIVVRPVPTPADPVTPTADSPGPGTPAGAVVLHPARPGFPPLVVTPGTGDWAAAQQAARELTEMGFDWDFYRRREEELEREAAEALRDWQERQQQPEDGSS